MEEEGVEVSKVFRPYSLPLKACICHLTRLHISVLGENVRMYAGQYLITLAIEEIWWMEQWLGAVWQRDQQCGGIRVLHRGRFTNVEDNPPPPPPISRHAEILSGILHDFHDYSSPNIQCQKFSVRCFVLLSTNLSKPPVEAWVTGHNQMYSWHWSCWTTLRIRM